MRRNSNWQIEVEIQIFAYWDRGDMMPTHAIGSKISIQELIDAVVTKTLALNYFLIIGGANELNIWLNSQGYYSTKMSANLGVNDLVISQAWQQVPMIWLTCLITIKISCNEKVSAVLKEAVLKRQCLPLPADLTTVTRRYEMTPDQAGPYASLCR